MFIVDTHAHAFTISDKLAEGRRYTPQHAAPLDDYLAELDRAHVTHAVLVQPSFLGTDNSYLLACLRRLPHRLRGIAVIDPSWDDAALAQLDSSGVVGIRLNLLGMDPAFISGDNWQNLFHRVAALDWQIEIHADGARLPFLLDALWPSGANIVVDHFGRPDPALGLKDPGVKAMLGKADEKRIWVKLSGPYRCLGDADAYARAYLDAFGAQRLLWGSDWPWTQHSDAMSYEKSLTWIHEWIANAADREAILSATALQLFKFE